MARSLVDLSVGGTSFPDPIVVDTNLIVDYIVVPFITTIAPPPTTVNAQRADQFFRALIAGNGTGVVTPTAFAEFVHAAVKVKYSQERLRLGSGARQTYGRPVPNWLSLYKQDATILQAFLPDLDQLRRLLVANGLLLLAPTDLGPIPSGRTYDEELIHLVGTYGLDSNDALILMEAQRFGLTDIISLDTDLRRARADFTIYTWL